VSPAFDTLWNILEVKCCSGISVRLWILSYPSVYWVDLTLMLTRAH
jgi:hypothetical protein